MTQRPLLFFPSKERASRSPLTGGGDNLSLPSPRRQGERLTPKFEALFNTLEEKRIHLQQTATGTDPQEVLVFETRGRVEDFICSIEKYGGLEWLGEIDIEDIKPDEDFHESNEEGHKKEKELNGRLYLVFTNHRAMRQLLDLWKRWVKDGNFDTSKGEHKGKGALKEVFKRLHDIRKWDIQDRFEESKTLQYWEEDVRLNPDRPVRFEIEPWYRSGRARREEAQHSITRLIVEKGGNVISTSDIPGIHYHGILAELPAEEIQSILEIKDTELVRCENIMFFKPSGQVVVGGSYNEKDLITHEETMEFSLPEGDPIAAILDGLPLVQHQVLKDRLIIDDPDNIEEDYQANERKHGTAMCSLIARGDLSNNEEPISRPLYIRPIMRPCIHNREKEFIPNDQLLVDIIHRAVHRIFRDEGDDKAAAPSVRIINLSIGDPGRLFYHSMSPWSRLLDWLSYEYSVLFIVSSGNHFNTIQIDIPASEFKNLSTMEIEKFFLTSFLNNARNYRLLSPSESINCLSVGALHGDNSNISEHDQRINPYSSLLPATYTAIGGGYRKSIKPDLVYYGGRQMFDFDLNTPTLLKPSGYKSSPGIKVAAPDSSLSKTLFDRGTSIATALITRSAHFCYKVLEELIEENKIEIPENIVPVIIKAMLIHGCSWDDIEKEFERRLDIDDTILIRKFKNQVFGYGLPDFNKVKECTEQRATVVGFGELTEEEAHVYDLPLPPSLASSTTRRRLTVTLAWFTPVSTASQRYRTARLWFETEANNPLVKQRQNTDDKAVKRGTLQHEVFKGTNAVAFEDGDSISIKVNCSKDAGSFEEKIPYAILVSLETAKNEEVNLPIYQEVSERISIPIGIRQQV